MIMLVGVVMNKLPNETDERESIVKNKRGTAPKKAVVLSFVGVGPGDPALLTVAAVRALAAADEIAVADSGTGESVVLRIIGEYIAGKPVVRLRMPMGAREEWDAAHEAAARVLIEKLEQGRKIAYPVLGDPSLYASSGYLYRWIAPKYRCEIIPGVPAMCAAAAALGVPLAEGRERLTICLGLFEGEALPEGAVVVMKAGRSLPAIYEVTDKREAYAVRNLGMPGQAVGSVGELCAEASESYFTTVLIRPKKE